MSHALSAALLSFVLALTLAATLSASSAWAGSPDSGAQAAARAAQKQHGGRVLDVEKRGDHYRVKLLKDSGKVKVVKVPAQNRAGERDRGRARDRDR
jgi:hypothetical protein